jgi:mono/diheme cytochrome c family protein
MKLNLSRLSLCAGLMALAASQTVHAQIGDDPREGAQVALPAARKMVPTPALSAAEELRSFQLPPGFRIELVAAEPLVRDPVAAAYDLEGNLWVVELSDYNYGLGKDLPALAPAAERDQVPTCKLIKLEASHHDGRYDRRIVWLDHLVQPKGILVVHDGILIADQPNLWLARDLHHTGHCDDKLLLSNTFEAWTDPEESGSMMWGRDNIIHDIDAPYDIRYRHGALEKIAVPIRGQFGLSQDDWGRIYSNRNSDQLHCDLFAPTYSVRSPHFSDAPWAYVRIAQSQEVWPSHPTPAINRAYRKGVLGQQTGGLRDNGTLLEFTAACSPLVYRGANYPQDFYHNVFVPEPTANLIKRNVLLEHQAQITAVDAYQGHEFLTSTDSRFRPVALLNSPDGSMLVVDLYHGILQEYHYITTYLRNQTLGRRLELPMSGLGRLFRIVAVNGPLETKTPALNRMDAPALAQVLASPNAWWRDASQQELVERNDKSAAPALEELAQHGATPATRVAALWTLDGLEATSLPVLQRALADPSAKVRAAAVRLHERLFSGPDGEAALRQLTAALPDPDAEVSAQAAFSLGEAKGPGAIDAMYNLLLGAGDQPFVPQALVTGLADREFEFFGRLTGQLETLGGRPEIDEMLTALASAIVHKGDPAQVQELIARASDSGNLPVWARRDIVAGFQPLVRPAFRRSVGLTRVVKAAALAPLVSSTEPSIHDAALKVQTGMAREEEQARQREANARPLDAAEQALYEKGRVTFQLCASCHQQNGAGLPRVAPSLVDSHWVGSYPEVLVRIVLCGKEGTPGFPGAMPPIAGTFDDPTIAGVLTYVRNSWGLHYGAVDLATVAKVRAEVGSRQAAWNDSELRRVESEAQRQHARAKPPTASPARTH